jgi:hypothetical protein
MERWTRARRASLAVAITTLLVAAALGVVVLPSVGASASGTTPHGGNAE